MGQVFLISPIKRQIVEGFSFWLVCWMWLIKLQTHDRCMIQMILLIVMASSMSYQSGVDRLMPVKCFIKRIQMKQTVAVDHVSFNNGFKWKILIRITFLSKGTCTCKTPRYMMPRCFGWFTGCLYAKKIPVPSLVSGPSFNVSLRDFSPILKSARTNGRLYKKVQLQSAKSMKYLKNHSWLQHILNV